ncbi:hypothetical protein A5819_003691 [Enterococcus sp. 7E2_DIV0204]|uniref:type III secretion system protein PrgH n=1 Tax=unclassified Enterococcus TaxID=2608891 RepID=UPI000A34BB71|nr:MULTISPECIES: type III secretion system protein PrgH [unclassified Enterococcus]OTN83872.1 hypothetical protein A5819_003691 [Enterococcus sp. 7E2_DIV0204]OTP46658.1 hypothetical protein A5881_003884 [Enterococcus termitis]OTP47564.1 hypothetical protein A5884_003535 [Enterococcus sp. 7D2_DIV0200]
MKIPQATLDQLFKSLGEYNPTTNAVMGKISMALIPLGMAILGILFMVEMTSTTKKFKMEDGGLGVEVLTDLAMKYIIAFVLIMSSGYIVDAIVWFGIQATKWINSVISNPSASEMIPPMEKVSWWAKPIVFLFQVFAYLALDLSGLVTTIIVFLRGLQLYIVKAIAPILIAFFVNDELRSIAVGFLKQVMALVLQGALLVLILGLIPILTANDYLSMGSLDGGIWANAGTVIVNIFMYIHLILKYVAIIIMLIGSQGLAKRLMGAM